MADIVQKAGVSDGGKRRRTGNKKKGKMSHKRQRGDPHKVKVDQKMKKLFQKRARDYNSDDSEEDEDAQLPYFNKKNEEFEVEDNEFEEEQQFGKNEDDVSEDENEDADGGVEPGVTKFAEGIKSFRLAFKKIVKKSGDDDDVMGPVLSAHKKLIAEKLADEEVEKKVKGEERKKKLLKKEKGHVKPDNYLDAHEKFLLSVATKGVVKLFNAVNKAQNAQRGLNPSRSKDEKVIKQRRKDAFFSELGKKSVKAGTSGGSVDDDAPAWAPMRDNYMLTNPKLKDWDKMQDTNEVDDFGRKSDSDSDSGDD